MTYSLHTLHSPTRKKAPEPAAPGLSRFANEIALVVGFVLLALWLIALLSHSVQDAAWSTSGSGAPTHNHVGRLGALWSDLS